MSKTRLSEPLFAVTLSYRGQELPQPCVDVMMQSPYYDGWGQDLRLDAESRRATLGDEDAMIDYYFYKVPKPDLERFRELAQEYGLSFSCDLQED